MESATITKVTLRKEKLRSGKLSLYLDYYPPIWNPHIKKMSRREFLGLYLIGNPKDKFELDYNEEIMLKARGIRATRELAIINEEFGFLDRTKKQADFLEYFESKTKEKYQKWEIVYKPKACMGVYRRVLTCKSSITYLALSVPVDGEIQPGYKNIAVR